MSKKIKGYKVTTNDRSRKIGIACSSLKQLKEKVQDKFNVDKNRCRIYLGADGAEIDDEEYFSTIKEQTLLIVADQDQKIVSDYDLVLKTLNSDIIKVGKTINDFITENRDSQTIFRLLIEANKDLKEKTSISSRDEHEDWFQYGNFKNCSTKEEVMKRKAQDRIRGYYYKIKDEILHSDIYKTNPKARSLLTTVLECFKYLLIAADYFSCIFDRTHPYCHPKISSFTDEIDGTISKRRKLEIINLISDDKFLNNQSQLQKTLCTPKGDFYCFGRWSESMCQYQKTHRINPYSSRESLILFQTWNLDHQVELTRSVMPSLLENVCNIVSGTAVCKYHKTKATDVSIYIYFKEFFTLDNLKLVHIVCHDKSTHELYSKGTVVCPKCEEYKFIQRLKEIIG